MSFTVHNNPYEETEAQSKGSYLAPCLAWLYTQGGVSREPYKKSGNGHTVFCQTWAKPGLTAISLSNTAKVQLYNTHNTNFLSIV